MNLAFRIWTTFLRHIAVGYWWRNWNPKRYEISTGYEGVYRGGAQGTGAPMAGSSNSDADHFLAPGLHSSSWTCLRARTSEKCSRDFGGSGPQRSQPKVFYTASFKRGLQLTAIHSWH